MSNEVTVIKNQMQSSADIKSHVAIIQSIMRDVMKKGTHYDTIKGCGDKPVLLKSGAEKILQTFMFATEFEVEDLSTEINKHYRVITKLMHQGTGVYMGSGIGECMSLESKYAWRSAVCDEEYDETSESLRRVHYKKGWNGKPVEKIKQVRQDIYSMSNTILKMAKKRSLIDAVMNVTACSDIFDQDVDESHINDSVFGEEPPETNTKPKTTLKSIVDAFEAARDEAHLKTMFDYAQTKPDFKDSPDVNKAFDLKMSQFNNG